MADMAVHVGSCRGAEQSAGHLLRVVVLDEVIEQVPLPHDVRPACGRGCVRRPGRASQATVSAVAREEGIVEDE